MKVKAFAILLAIHMPVLAALWFARDVLPRIHRQMGAPALFRVAGSGWLPEPLRTADDRTLVEAEETAEPEALPAFLTDDEDEDAADEPDAAEPLMRSQIGIPVHHGRVANHTDEGSE